VASKPEGPTAGRRRYPAPFSWWLVAALALAAGDSIAQASARPFSWRADLTTAGAVAAIIAGGAVSLWKERSARATAPLRRVPPATAYTCWALVITAMAAFELTELFGAPRRDHPTMSSLLTSLSGHEVSRATIFALWVVAGYWIWRR
jgi:hypothetical protein